MGEGREGAGPHVYTHAHTHAHAHACPHAHAHTHLHIRAPSTDAQGGREGRVVWSMPGVLQPHQPHVINFASSWL